jgi:hypothetical protein
MSYSDLEIGFHPRDEQTFDVELRFEDPAAHAGTLNGPYPVVFDWDALRRLELSPTEYAVALTDMVFGAPETRAAFANALAATARQDGLRIRLYLTQTAARLHGIFWETLLDPQSRTPLATNERVLLSRFMASADMRPVYLRRRAALRALVVIADPAELGARLGIAPIPADTEWQRVRTSLVGIPATCRTGGGKASIESIEAMLREEQERGGFDIFYLVCHGSLGEGREPVLWLENSTGAVEPVKGAELVRILRDVRRPPRLVILASCQSAGEGDEASTDDKGALAALGPQLAAAGIPAVVAMQGRVRLATASGLFAIFFRELAKDGQIDRAMAVARRALPHRHADWWVPVLITRLREGSIWDEHPVEDEEEFRNWSGLVSDVDAGTCTPILGPDLAAAVLGSQVEMAREWAKRYAFPMAPSERDSLPQVAQYLERVGGHELLLRELRDHLWQTLVRSFGERFPEHAKGDPRGQGLADLLRDIGKLLREREERDPYWVLARMPFSIFVTTKRDHLLFDALADAPVDGNAGARKRPRLEVCRWAVFQEDLERTDEKDRRLWPESVFTQDPQYVPSVAEPLVFHAFGHMDYPETLVLTEDDFFDYLIGIMKNRPGVQMRDTAEHGQIPIPQPVINALCKTGLLFLGFRLSDWEFRTLFRHILAQEQSSFRRTPQKGPKHVNVSVQLMPAQGEFIAPRGARDYLQKYFTEGYNVQIAWGSAESFVQRLYEIWRAPRAGSSGG